MLVTTVTRDCDSQNIYTVPVGRCNQYTSVEESKYEEKPKSALILFVNISQRINRQPCIHKYFDFHYWCTEVAWYLIDQVKSNQVLKNLGTHALCSVNISMIVD